MAGGARYGVSVGGLHRGLDSLVRLGHASGRPGRVIVRARAWGRS